MALVNPGLADRLESATNAVRGKEAAARDNPYPLGLYKALVSYALLMIIALLWRPDGTNALDYDDAQRTSEENFFKQKTVHLLTWYLSLLRQEPVRTWPEVDTLAQCLDDLTTSEETDWPLRSIELGGQRGIVVDRKLSKTLMDEIAEWLVLLYIDLMYYWGMTGLFGDLETER